MSNKVSFLAAHNGGIQMFAEGHSLVGWGNTPNSVAYVLKTKGMAEVIHGSSSMDFASEEGFDSDDGAHLLLKKALEIV
tara:strand:+ start:162 stop:398 length:237 start_codon:yes stop_codon:yes gene_type:complete